MYVLVRLGICLDVTPCVPCGPDLAAAPGLMVIQQQQTVSSCTVVIEILVYPLCPPALCHSPSVHQVLGGALSISLAWP